MRDLKGLQIENEIRSGGGVGEDRGFRTAPIKQSLLRSDAHFGAVLRVPEDPFESTHTTEVERDFLLLFFDTFNYYLSSSL